MQRVLKNLLVTRGVRGSVSGPVLFNTFTDLDVGIKYKFADGTKSSVTKLGENIDLLEGRKALKGKLVRLDCWAETNSMKVLPLGHNNPRQGYRLGEMTGKLTSEKDLGVLVNSS
ncbi:hypothetical protein HGM15179_007830 [Zosterops borbonicus]|uniref:Uncharacterized protein n=1 Tax=Zosterops borbonicus TaxID=364589 RepID=A0A8K1GI11_9PASS|nr:hypothetical protein HGM15179_007830 [Zosterops borbonicus]